MMRLVVFLVICVCVPLCIAQDQLYVTPGDITGEEGQEYEFICHSPDTDPSWYREFNSTYEVKLVTDSKYEVFVHINTDNETSLGYLRIKNAAPEDGGTYKCRQGTASFTAELTIYPVKDVVISPAQPEFVENADLLLNCTVNGDADQEVSWTYNNGAHKDPIPVPNLDDTGHTQIFNNGSLIIRGLKTEDAGIYYCTHTFTQGEETASVSIGGDITLTAEKSVKYTEGDRALIVCEAHVLSPVLLPNITWFINGTALEDTSRFLDGTATVENTLKSDVDVVSQLELIKITMADRLNYTCVATNTATMTSKDILLRVRDRLAALWPFLGIVSEVIILIVIIFIHEKCSKGEDIGEDDEDDDDLKKEKQQMNDGDSMKRGSNQ